jgi:hypothetical protein
MIRGWIEADRLGVRAHVTTPPSGLPRRQREGRRRLGHPAEFGETNETVIGHVDEGLRGPHQAAPPATH